jgi:carboxymethylenebutenolidase
MFGRRNIAIVMLASLVSTHAVAQIASQPETVSVHSGSVTLRALIWRPQDLGPFPAILFVHGSGRTLEQLRTLGPYQRNAEAIGPLFARHGYVFLFVFRRGVGLSAEQAPSALEMMNRELASNGEKARNAVQLQLLEHRELDDTRAALALLRARPEVDAGRIAAVGHSFGSSLAILLADREPELRAIVLFSVAGYSWDRSPELRARLLDAVSRVRLPVLLIHAANDYSLAPGKALDARLRQLGKEDLLKIYSPVGHTADEGHDIPYLGIDLWERDVFAFLDDHTQL